MGGLAWRERAAVDDTRGGIAQRHCPVPGAGVVEGPVPGPGLARAPCRRRVRRPDQVPHRGGRLPRETPSGRARGAGVEVLPGDVVVARGYARPGRPAALEIPAGGGLPSLTGSRASR